MDEATARMYIERFTAWDSVPALTAPEVTDLVTVAQRTDINGREPVDPLWVETYDVRAAAAIGWEWKYAKAIGNYDFTNDGSSYSKSQVVANIEKMMAYYSGRGSSKTLMSIPISTQLGVTDPALLYPEQIP